MAGERVRSAAVHRSIGAAVVIAVAFHWEHMEAVGSVFLAYLFFVWLPMRGLEQRIAKLEKEVKGEGDRRGK